MFGNSLDRVLGHFTDQFEAAGDDYLYRRNMLDAPIRVSAAERDAMVAAFRRSLRLILWGFAAAVFLLIFGFVAITVALDIDPPSVSFWLFAVIAPLVALYLFVWLRAWNAPARMLARRAPAGGERTRAEVRRIALARMSWWQILTSVAVIALGFLKIASNENIFEGWHRLWLPLFAVAAVAIAVRIWRKWRLGYEDPPTR